MQLLSSGGEIHTVSLIQVPALNMMDGWMGEWVWDVMDEWG